MFEVMYASNGVGLAGPQVGVALRIFVCNPTLEPGDERVYVNPELTGQSGSLEGEEGCLSFPGIVCKVKRYARVTIRFRDLAGEPTEEVGEDLLARIFQHEYDHLVGMLLSDRMGPAARIANRRALKELETAAG
jgi:peptide deformylase